MVSRRVPSKSDCSDLESRSTRSPLDGSPTDRPGFPAGVRENNLQFLLLPRKEVIQPHLPVQLPCYDFVPVTNPTLGVCLPKVSSTTSGVASFHDVTGDVYKPRERIHRGSADPRLLATPGSCRRVAACNPNWDRVWGIRSASRRGKPVVPAIVACV